MRTVRAIVSGRVQGVWFRAHTREKAIELGVVGFVRNRSDGTVEIVAKGEQGPIDALIDWASLGSPMAEVSGVRVEDLEDEGEYSSFEVSR